MQAREQKGSGAFLYPLIDGRSHPYTHIVVTGRFLVKAGRETGRSCMGGLYGRG